MWKTFFLSLLYLSLVINSTIIEYDNGKKNISENHPCKRICKKKTHPMVCHYKFSVEWYKTMSRACYNCPDNPDDCNRPQCIPGDGVSRPILVINRQMPGPSIEVCQGDEIVVDVENLLVNEETSIHWHGQHQRETPYMDGVPHVTQCAIPSGSTFTYRFRATQRGTHFWHSHSGLQRGDGAFGPLIVRIENDPHTRLYDFDLSSHVLIILDWIHETSLSKYINHHHDTGNNKPETLLVNGIGLYPLTNSTNNIAPPRYTVDKGFRYRFRVINAGFLNCPIEVSVDNHTLTMISSDGNDFEPVDVDSFVTYAGERFDFIVNANQEINNYWVRFRGLMDCDERFLSAHQAAVLHYSDADTVAYPEGAPTYETSHKEGLQLNALNEGTTNVSSVSIPKLNSTSLNDVSLKETPDYQFYIVYDFYNISNPRFYAKGLYEFFTVDKKYRRYTPQFNHISMKFQAFPLLPGRDLIEPEMFCNETNVKNCDVEYCECTHVLQVSLGSVVELVLVDTGNTYDANHPFHLHGNVFRVVAMERLGTTTTVEEVKKLDADGLIKRKLDRAPLKDTVTVPDGGFTVLRFHANNPGYWLFHCHIDFHAEMGMAIVFKVGEHDDIAKVPTDFPTCGSWKEHEQPRDPQNCNITIEIANLPLYKKFWYEIYPSKDCYISSGQISNHNIFVFSFLMIMLTILF